MARTRKTQAGGVPMWLRKFTQRVGNSNPFGYIAKFKKVFPIDKEINGSNYTYKYFILEHNGSGNGMKLNTRLSNINNIQCHDASSSNIVDICSKITNDIENMVNTMFITLYNTGKLGFIICLNNGKMQYNVYYKDPNAKPRKPPYKQAEVDRYNGPIRIFLYMPIGYNHYYLPSKNMVFILKHYQIKQNQNIIPQNQKGIYSIPIIRHRIDQTIKIAEHQITTQILIYLIYRKLDLIILIRVEQVINS